MTQLPFIRRKGAREQDTYIGYDMVRPHRDDRLTCDICKLEISSRLKYQSRLSCECDRIFGSQDDASAGLASKEGGFDLDEHNHPPRESCFVRTVVLCDSCPLEGGQDHICRSPVHYEAVIRDRELMRLTLNGWEVFPHASCSMERKEGASDCVLHYKLLAPGSTLIPPRASEMNSVAQDAVLLHGARVRAWCPSCNQADAALCDCPIKLRVYTINGVLAQMHLQGHQIMPYQASIFEQHPDLVPFPSHKTRYSTLVEGNNFFTKVLEKAEGELHAARGDVELTPPWKEADV